MKTCYPLIPCKKKRYDKAPSTAMQRFLAGFIRILPVEGRF